MRPISRIIALVVSVFYSCLVISATQPPKNLLTHQKLIKAQEVIASSTGLFYLQAGQFSNVRRAQIYRKQLVTDLHHLVTVKTRGQYHVVLIGPFKTFTAMRAFISGKNNLVVS
ncbi:MAG: SPOR domain-containing protein [Legionella sp.]